MAFIWDKFNENLSEPIQSDKIWQHLETMYNLEALDESESLPFPNDETEFCLPESEFGALKVKKEEKAEEQKNIPKHTGRETPKNVKEIKKEEKPPNKAITKEVQRRDSKDGKTTPVAKKELKKEVEKPKPSKSRNSLSGGKEENKSKTVQKEETPRSEKRLTRGSQKIDDSGSNGKASPVPSSSGNNKRRRV